MKAIIKLLLVCNLVISTLIIVVYSISVIKVGMEVSERIPPEYYDMPVIKYDAIFAENNTELIDVLTFKCVVLFNIFLFLMSLFYITLHKIRLMVI